MNNFKLSKDEKGYALIEVLFLVTVISILSAIALPKVENAFKTVYADYLMKTLYSEIRFLQSSVRISYYNDEDAFSEKKIIRPFRINIKNEKYYVETFKDKKELRVYYMRPNFSFERSHYHIMLSPEGILNTGIGPSNSLILTFDSKECNPKIVFDSVGRIRFENSNAIKK